MKLIQSVKERLLTLKNEINAVNSRDGYIIFSSTDNSFFYRQKGEYFNHLSKLPNDVYKTPTSDEIVMALRELDSLGYIQNERFNTIDKKNLTSEQILEIYYPRLYRIRFKFIK